MTVEIEAGDRALVTGASGFVGSAVVAALRAGGKSVRTLLRATSPRDNLPPDVEIAIGDLRDPAAMKAAMRGVRYLFHVAADYRLWARDPREIVAANVEGTRNAMEAAAAAGVARIVYTSSVATLALRAGAIGDERAGLDEAQAIGAYKRSKVAAERLVDRMIGQGLPAVIVNPSTPIGPRDRRPTPTGRILVEAANGRMPAYVDTGLNLVHVDDVAAGHLAALARGRIGERYILGGDNVAFGDLLATIAAATGRKPPRVRLPRAPLFPLAFAAEAVARITGREPFITADGLRMAKNRMFFTSAKAEREIGYVHRPWREGLDDALAWFRVKGLIP
ncbi:MAG: hopanoid-associated sugar epimerase [Roseiarcus sp.]|jgi:dihydroflavonol-4-reductase